MKLKIPATLHAASIMARRARDTHREAAAVARTAAQAFALGNASVDEVAEAEAEVARTADVAKKAAVALAAAREAATPAHLAGLAEPSAEIRAEAERLAATVRALADRAADIERQASVHDLPVPLAIYRAARLGDVARRIIE